MDVSIKGTGDGLLITFEEGEWPECLTALDERLQETAQFFQGGRVTLHLADRTLSEAEIRQASDLLTRHGLQFTGVIASVPETRQAARRLGVRVREVPERRRPRSITEQASQGILVRRTLRSGQVIRHYGHVVVIGDVNPGAEIIATGDVVVWGRLRGMVHAGASGDQDALVCALQLAPTQLRIAEHIARPPDEEVSGGGKARRSLRGRSGNARRASLPGGGQDAIIPEVARVHEGHILVEPWE